MTSLDPEEQLLYRNVLSDPDNDRPRLNLADYWEQTGQTVRAEFVRLQIEKEALLQTKVGETTKPLEVLKKIEEFELREHELLNSDQDDNGLQYETLWMVELLLLLYGRTAKPLYEGLPRNEGRIFEWKWIRGFIGWIKLSLDDLQQHAADLLWTPDSREPCNVCDGVIHYKNCPYGPEHHKPLKVRRTSMPISQISLVRWNGPVLMLPRDSTYQQQMFVHLKSRYPSIKEWILEPNHETLEVYDEDEDEDIEIPHLPSER